MVKSTLIYPANEKVIAKYRQEEKFIIHETAEDYQTITVEYIKKYQMDLKVRSSRCRLLGQNRSKGSYITMI